MAPWFDQVLPRTWQRELPAVLVVPTRGQANDLKARLIAKGSSHLGLKFVTPSSLRALLARDDATPAAEPEHLRLLLAISASELEDRPNESEALASKAVARAPALLLRALDRLETAGWKFEQLGLPSFAPVVQRFNELLKKCGFVLRGETDRRRLQQAACGSREFSHVLIIGFDGAHWAEWFLRAAEPCRGWWRARWPGLKYRIMMGSATLCLAFSSQRSGRRGSNCNAHHDSLPFCVF